LRIRKLSFQAQTKGIGSCLWGRGRLVFNGSRAARELLGLQKGESILGILLLGYPAVTFRNKVEGKRVGIHWPDKR